MTMLPRGLAGPTPTEAAALRAAATVTNAYTLPTAKLVQAQALERIGETLTVGDTFWGPAQMVLILALGWAALLRRTAERSTRRLFLQAGIFVAGLALVTTLLNLPLAIYGHTVGLRYGLLVQGWGSWAWDKAKGYGLAVLLGTIGAWVLVRVIRRFPRRWWLVMWPVGIAFSLAGVLVTPYVIDPLFNRFEPLQQTDPALVAQLERVVRRAGETIPPSRMVLMRASDKVTGLNAYVTGFGPSKRIVVWDTTVAHSTTPEILFVFAHELGHYALGHIVLGLELSAAGMLPFLWLTNLGATALLRRFGTNWRVSGLGDLAALPVLLLVGSVLSTIADPIGNAVSRRMEHNADVYGQEAMHTILPHGEIGVVGRRSFQVLGETSLEDPTPHPLFEWWYGTHPPIELRAAFAELYDPWAPGQVPKYFPR